ncbi:Transmembrane domain-containing protein [Spironucleus salmonicida]|nr:Transmembrane domain-containing protein [Spironucleus salmonicida]
MLIFGTSSTLTGKGMSQFDIVPCAGCPPIKFSHPYVQTLFMFIGEFLCLGLYFLIDFINKKKGVADTKLKEGKVFYKFWPHVFLFLVPTACDTAASTLYNVGLYFSIASVYQILRNVRVIFVALLSLCIWRDFRVKFDLPQVFGLVVLFLGATLVALSAIVFGTADSTAVSPILGVVLTILGCLFSALFYCSEELFLRKIQTTGLMGVGNEGGWGIIIYAILLPIFNTVTDPFSSKNPKEVFDNLSHWVYQMGQSVPEIIIHIAYSFSAMGFNYSGMEVTNNVSAAARSTFDACRVILVWVVSLIVGWETWENKKQFLQIAGFVLVTFGVLTYNNIVRVIPFLRESNKIIWGRPCSKLPKVEPIEAEMQPATENNEINVFRSSTVPLVDEEAKD